jgi:acetyl-CoA carboxylase carboxyltransferase component
MDITMNDLQHRFNSLREEAQLGGGTDRIAAQHAKGKATARERIEKLLDPDSFHEIGQFVTHRAVGLGMEKSHLFGDGVVTGWGKIDGRVVYLFAQDFTVMGGSVGEVHGKKIAHLMDLAIQSGAPLIGLNDSGGARIQEGVDALAGYGEIFMRNVQASGVIPQISVILGPCAGGAVYSPAITDFIFLVEKNAHMFITGPEVVKTVTREEISAEDLGGAEVHSNRSGVAHFTAADEDALLQKVRWLLSFLPSNNLAVPPHVNTGDDLSRETPEIAGLIPENPQHPYDILKVIEAIADNGDFLEVQSSYATNLVVGFIHLNGNPVGVVANQPDTYAGVLDINASDKGARFIRFCDAFHIPLLTLVDTPGFMPGAEQEYGALFGMGRR